MQAEFFALQGVAKLVETVGVERRRLNKKLAIVGVVATRYDARKNLNRGVIDKIREHFGDKLFATPIRENIALAEAPSHGRTIFEHEPASHGAEDYLALAGELLERG